MTYIPERGDVIWIDLDLQVKHEPARRRLALVLSPSEFNLKTSLCVLCPITGRIKGYPFEVIMSDTDPNVVLSDQIKSLDWKERNAEKESQADEAVLGEVVGKLKELIS